MARIKVNLTNDEKAAAYDKIKEREKYNSRKRQAKVNVILKKAEQKGIRVTKAEIDAEMKRLK